MNSDSRLMHTVVFWLKPDAPAGTPATMADFYYQRIAGVDGVEQVFAGSPAGTDREVVDNSYQLLTSVVFRDKAAQDAWQTDPVHDTFRETFGPAFERVVVYDNLEAN